MQTSRTDYPQADVRQSCVRKKEITDEGLARRIANKMRWAGKPVVYYACRHCGAFHIGREPRNED